MTKIELTKWKECAPMPLPRAGCAVAAVGGKVIVAGGTYWLDGQKFWCDRADAFDPVTNQWKSLPPIPRIAGDAAGVAADGKFAVIGGGGSGPGAVEVWAFDGTAWLNWPAIPAPRRSCVAVFHDGRIFVFGGLSGNGTEFTTATNTVWCARPGEAWQPCAPIPAPLRFNLAVGSVGGRILVAGGCTADASGVRNLDDVLAYDAAADRWSSAGRLPTPCRGSAGVGHHGQLLVVGGYTDRFIDTLVAFDPVTGKTTPAGRLPVGLADTRFVAIGERIVGVTGEDGIKHRYTDTLISAAN